MKELLKRLGITEPGYFNDEDGYVVDLESSDQFSKVSSRLDKSDELEELEDSSHVTLEASNIMYQNDEFILNLMSDFSQDLYKLVVTKKEEIKDE